MKRSMKLSAVLAVLSVFLFSCSEDPDISPGAVLQSQVSQPLLEGDWQLVTSDNNGRSLHFDGDLAVQKEPDGSVVRASNFKLESQGGDQSIAYIKNQFVKTHIEHLPNLFDYNKIVSVSAKELVLQGEFVLTFKRLNPVN